ncbi:Hypoxic response protein 1 [Aquisphaera giovannonii]|uniref:Hypoxic response protein 1 n=1 Tax=Aquisphaera giovannonii TaxID=406548 RepID=A0A5B9W2I7_9BACT|nr:CBS domain-containing protein [Aquisphaera giovannonii]QEH34788.1 Hypoxic response protein 1 [Aquisphaera giovannonii]
MITEGRRDPAARAGLSGGGRTVAELMRTDFRSCNASTPIPEVAAALLQSRCPVLAVTRAQVPIGIVTGRGLASALADRGGDLSGLTAADVMAEDAPTIPMNASAEEAAGRLAGADGGLLAVDEDGLLKGVVTPEEVRPAPGPRAGDPAAEIKASKSQAQPHPWDSPAGAHPEPVPLVTPADMVNPMLAVADVMMASPRTCSPESTVLEAVLIFRDAGCGAVPVTEGGKPVGILTDRDVALASARGGGPVGATVGDLMTRDVASIAPDATLADAIVAFRARGVRRLLVVHGEGVLAGILSWADLIGHVSERGLGHVVAGIESRRGA